MYINLYKWKKGVIIFKNHTVTPITLKLKAIEKTSKPDFKHFQYICLFIIRIRLTDFDLCMNRIVWNLNAITMKFLLFL